MTDSNIRIEYRVRPVVRYFVTRWYGEEHPDGSASGGCEERGEFDHPDTAYDVAYALAKAEHEAHGWPPGDMRMIYPKHPNDANATYAYPAHPAAVA